MRRTWGTLASFSKGEIRFVQPANAHSFDLRIGSLWRALHSDPMPTFNAKVRQHECGRSRLQLEVERCIYCQQSAVQLSCSSPP